jgi:hypothetical protein
MNNCIKIIVAVILIYFITRKLLSNDSIKVYESNRTFNKQTVLPGMKENSKLSILLNDISSADKVVLSNITDQWSVTKHTIDDKIKSSILPILNGISYGISLATGNEYIINSIENVFIMKDDNENYRCIVNWFVNDVKNFFTIKMVADFVKTKDDVFINFIDIDESGNHNIINNYDVKWDSHGILSESDMFEDNVSEILDTYYYNNHELIHLHYKNKNTIIDTSPAYTLNQLKKAFFPSNIPIKRDSPSFCNKDTDKWDNQSVFFKGDEGCIHNNNSYELYPNTPINGPGTITENPDDNEYKWLFNSDRGVLRTQG